MKKLEISQLERTNGGYDCNTGKAQALFFAVAGGMLCNPGCLIISAVVSMANVANGC
jgi:hypothetical protein